MANVNNNVWHVHATLAQKKSKDSLLKILAENRGLKTKKDLDEFLNPNLDQILAQELTDTQKAVTRIIKAIKNKEKIIVYSDYDADGICATAIMWETLHDFGADVMPYVPHRIKEGYGLAKEAISELKEQGASLIITVDHGVTAVDQVAHAKKIGIDVIITDHHVLPKMPPKSFALVHTTNLCGAGVSWRLAWEIAKKFDKSYQEELLEKLQLAALATIADLVPLLKANRAIVKIGLEYVQNTKKPGLRALIKACNIYLPITTYEIGHILAPRINAMGRIEHGLDSLRLLCAKNQQKADELAQLLIRTNSKRQDLTTKAVDRALNMVAKDSLIGVIHHESWHEGVIGLVASRMVETYKIPMIVISRREVFSKGSARSIPGFNIVEAIRSSIDLLVDAGGHPMAAGFTIETKNIDPFIEKMNQYAKGKITDEMLNPTIEVECELERENLTLGTMKTIETFEPYGVGNPQPLFLTRNLIVEDVRGVGPESRHLKLQVDGLSAIAFNQGELRTQVRPGYLIDLVYTISEDRYNGNGQPALKIKDLVINNN